jgi:hypothetical protein
LPGLPIVDDRHLVVGYVNLLELMAVCLDSEGLIDRAEEE